MLLNEQTHIEESLLSGVILKPILFNFSVFNSTSKNTTDTHKHTKLGPVLGRSAYMQYLSICMPPETRNIQEDGLYTP